MPKSTKSILSRSVSIYLNPYFKFLIDILMRREGYESRSDFISDMLEHLFVREGLWDEKKNCPTKEATKRSFSIRRLESMLHLLNADEEKTSIFDGLEAVVKKKKRVQ